MKYLSNCNVPNYCNLDFWGIPMLHYLVMKNLKCIEYNQDLKDCLGKNGQGMSVSE